MIGQLLGGRYEIIKLVGEGGMARVYKAKCTLLNRYVAVKVLKEEFSHDDEFVRKFRRESQAAASLSHPNIVSIYDVGTDELKGIQTHYIVMEYIKGKTLKEIIEKKGTLSEKETVNYSLQMANALREAHENNIIHRDIKPQNIMIDENNRIKVMDFGIARAATTSTITTTSDALGSVHYFSPEQARGGYTDEKSDIYSLGIVMYEMITGKKPYVGESPITVALKHIQEDIVDPSLLNDSISDELEEIILKCVEKRQVDRYLNIDKLLIDLNKIGKKYGLASEIVNVSDESLDIEDTLSQTRIMPALDEEIISKSENKPANIDDDIKKEKKQGRRMIFLGVLMAFILTSALFFGKDAIKGVFAKNEVEMPDLVGMTEEEARESLEELGLKLASVETREDDSVEPGIVLEQDVTPNTKLKVGFPINIIISTNSDLVEMPDLVGLNLLEAERILLRLGIGIGDIEKVPDESVAENTILSQSIAKGEEIQKGERVNLVVSKEVESTIVEMPNLNGLSIDEAKSILEDLGLQIGNIEEKESDATKGTITWQNYKTGTEIEKGTKINLQISAGQPEIEPEEPEETEETPEEVVVFTVNGGEGTEIKVIRIYNGQSATLVNKVVVGEDTIRVSGPKGSTLEVYYDGQLTETIDI